MRVTSRDVPDFVRLREKTGFFSRDVLVLGTLLELEGPVMKLEGPVMKFEGAEMKFEGAEMKFEGAEMKVEGL